MKGYMKSAMRGYHPQHWYWPLLKEVMDPMAEHLSVVRTEVVVGEAYPIMVIQGPRDVIRQMELNYDTRMRSLFPGKSYDELKKVEIEEIKKAHSK